MNFRHAETAEIVDYINGFDSWDAEQIEALKELADRAGIDPEPSESGDVGDFVRAIEKALDVDLGG